MPTASASPLRLTTRHLQLARAAFAAVAAIMVTFSGDHSAPVGLAVFSGFAIATGLVYALSAWLVFSSGQRGIPVLLAVVNIIAGMIAGVPAVRTTLGFFVIVIAWALVTGLIELITGLRDRRDSERSAGARDAITIGALTLLLAAVLPFVPMDYALEYFIEDAGRSFTLTGITIAVGIFGGYVAIVAVFLGIAGFSPDKRVAEPEIVTEPRVEA